MLRPLSLRAILQLEEAPFSVHTVAFQALVELILLDHVLDEKSEFALMSVSRQIGLCRRYRSRGLSLTEAEQLNLDSIRLENTLFTEFILIHHGGPPFGSSVGNSANFSTIRSSHNI